MKREVWELRYGRGQMIYGLGKFSGWNDDPKITGKHHSILSWVLIMWLRIDSQDEILFKGREKCLELSL